jgi:hypothetical protein
MKTSIIISGQINGNFKLRSAIITADCEEKKGMFNSIILVFKSKQAATKALSQGYQAFCKEMPEEKGNMSGFRYSRGSALYWDASKAVL